MNGLNMNNFMMRGGGRSNPRGKMMLFTLKSLYKNCLSTVQMVLSHLGKTPTEIHQCIVAISYIACYGNRGIL